MLVIVNTIRFITNLSSSVLFCSIFFLSGLYVLIKTCHRTLLSIKFKFCTLCKMHFIPCFSYSLIPHSLKKKTNSRKYNRIFRWLFLRSPMEEMETLTSSTAYKVIVIKCIILSYLSQQHSSLIDLF